MRTSQIIAASDHVILRRLDPSDFDIFDAYRRDPEVAKYQSWDEMNPERTRSFLQHSKTVTPLVQPHSWTQIAVARNDGTLVGDMGWFLSEDSTQFELGITIARQNQRKGYAREAMKLALRWAIESQKVKKVICGAHPDNTPSLNMIRALGFSWSHQEEGDEMFEMSPKMFRLLTQK